MFDRYCGWIGLEKNEQRQRDYGARNADTALFENVGTGYQGGE